MTQRTMYAGDALYAWRENAPNRTRAIDIDKWVVNQGDLLALLGALPQQRLTILDGTIAPESASVRVDTEGGAPGDELTAIAPGNLHAGMIMALTSTDPARVITVKNSSSPSGIQMMDAKDMHLNPEWPLLLRLVSTDALTFWQEIPGGRRAYDKAVEAQEAIVPPDGVTIKAVDGELKAIFPSPYELCEFYYFRHPTLRPGFQPCMGGLLEHAATLYPDAWGYLQTVEGQKLCKTEAEWQAMTTAIWHTNADGTTVGWNGIGGAPYYAPNTATGALRLPDLRGMYAEASGFDALGVGGARGDGMRRMQGQFHMDIYDARTSGVFTGISTSLPGYTSMDSDSWMIYFDSSRVVPVAPVNRPRAWGALTCCYLGPPAS